MAKILIEVKRENLNNLKDNDILMYDETNKYFYRTTPEKFFSQYENKLNNLLSRYDEQYKTLENKFNDLVEKNKKINDKLITMVEQFIKGGK